MSVWVTKPEEVKIDLNYVVDGASYPFFIKVKKFLTVGEQRRVQTSGWRGMRSGRPDEDGVATQEINIDWKTQAFARAEAYLLGWSLTGVDDAPLPITRESIESLNADVYALIDTALGEHITKTDEEKKLKAGA